MAQQALQLHSSMDESPDITTNATPLSLARHGCPDVDSSFFSKKGVIVQFINHNGTGSTSLIGGIRINVVDIREIPAYIDLNRYRIKRYGIKFLERHLRSTQCATGVGETLSDDDYGLSFSLATISANAAMINPSKRHEGPLFYCLHEGLVEPLFIGRSEDGTDDYAHVINCFIHLLPPSQRRTSVFKKAELEQQVPPPQQLAIVAPVVTSTAGKRPRQNNLLVRNSGVDQVKTNERMSQLEREIQNLRGLHLPAPPLPTPEAPPLWRQDGQASLPDDL